MSKKEIDEKKVEKTVDEVKETAEKAKDTAEKAVEETTAKVRNFKKLKYGSMFYIAIALVIAIVVVLNFMVGMFAKRSPIKIDITPDNRYELSEQSIEAVKAMDKDVEITVTATKDYFTSLGNYWENYYSSNTGVPAEIPFDMIPELLDKYSIYAEQGKGSINVKYVDMDKDPDIINKYKKYYNGDINRGSIIVASGERVRVLSDTDVMNMLSADPVAMQSQQLKFRFTGESVITSAITSVTDAHPIKVAFVKNMNGMAVYDEQSYGSAAQIFENEVLAKHGYDCTEIDISTDELKPADYDMIAVFAPSVDFNEDIIAKLSAFLYNDGQYGKNMVYVPDSSKMDLPNISEFLADWSIKVENELLYDETNAVGTDIFGNKQVQNVIADISSREDVGDVSNDKLYIVAPASRVLTKIAKNNEDIVTEVLKTKDTAFTVNMETYDPENPEYGEKGSRTVVMRSKKERADGFNTLSSSLLVIGSPGMFNQQLIVQNTTFNNSAVLLGIMNNMTGKDAGVVVPDKNIQSSFIAPSAKEAKNIQIIVVWVIPFIIAAIGVIVLLRRRNK